MLMATFSVWLSYRRVGAGINQGDLNCAASGFGQRFFGAALSKRHCDDIGKRYEVVVPQTPAGLISFVCGGPDSALLPWRP